MNINAITPPYKLRQVHISQDMSLCRGLAL